MPTPEPSEIGIMESELEAFEALALAEAEEESMLKDEV